MTERRGNWMQTYTGRQFWPLDPRPEEIVIEDIAHALSNQCRFAGHCTTFYSVAEHSVRVSNVVAAGAPNNADLRLLALLHDAAEAYLVDLPRPVKHTPEFAAYFGFEADLELAICARFELPMIGADLVKRADEILLSTERRDLMPSDLDWKANGNAPISAEPLEMQIRPIAPGAAEMWFLATFNSLQRQRGKHVTPIFQVQGAAR